jgi:serine phosphatase RsbU (regulator of sigma subunit)
MELYQQIFFSTLAIAFGILHGILYVYNPRLKSNLYFAIFLILYALNIFFDFQESFATNWETQFVYLRIHRAAMSSNSIFLLLFLYSVFDFKIAKQFWVIAIGMIGLGILAVYEPIDNFIYAQYGLIALTLESVRILASAASQKKEGSLIIIIGFMFLLLFSIYDLLLDLNLISSINDIRNGYPFGFGLMLISISIYLAQNFAKISKKNIEQEIKTNELEINERILKAEDARKSQELEEARKIQVSMLPQCVPDLKGFDFCFDMRTASEIGGDYYDYKIANDGEITIAIGDATGHGMRAGLMVSIIKSLFISHALKLGITEFFQEVTETIKQMKLNKLYMAMMLAKLKNGQLKISSAGMPPFYIYRYESKQVKEFVIKGMPLGAFDSFSYQTINTYLNPGDVLLLMSDGYPELFNDKDEILDNERIKDIFASCAEMPASEIVCQLFMAGDEWRNGKRLRDDITFVVCKMKPRKV